MSGKPVACAFGVAMACLISMNGSPIKHKARVIGNERRRGLRWSQLRRRMRASHHLVACWPSVAITSPGSGRM